MPQVIVAAMGGPLDGEVFDMRQVKKPGGLLLRWSVVEDVFHGAVRRYVVCDEYGRNITPYIWDGKRLSYEKA